MVAGVTGHDLNYLNTFSFTRTSNECIGSWGTSEGHSCDSTVTLGSSPSRSSASCNTRASACAARNTPSSALGSTYILWPEPVHCVMPIADTQPACCSWFPSSRNASSRSCAIGLTSIIPGTGEVWAAFGSKQATSVTCCPRNSASRGSSEICASCISFSLGLRIRRSRSNCFSALMRSAVDFRRLASDSVACFWNSAAVSCSIFRSAPSLSARSLILPASLTALRTCCSVSESSTSANLCSSDAFRAIRSENRYSPTMPATTSTAKNALVSRFQWIFSSRKGRTAYSPKIPIARTRVDRPDQTLSDAMMTSSSSLSTNPYYIYAARQRGECIFMGALGLAVIIARTLRDRPNRMLTIALGPALLGKIPTSSELQCGQRTLPPAQRIAVMDRWQFSSLAKNVIAPCSVSRHLLISNTTTKCVVSRYVVTVGCNTRLRTTSCGRGARAWRVEEP